MKTKKRIVINDRPSQEEVDDMYIAAEELFYTTRDPELKRIVQHWMHEISLQLFKYYTRMVAMEKLMDKKR